jgi:hypothetical protein
MKLENVMASDVGYPSCWWMILAQTVDAILGH